MKLSYNFIAQCLFIISYCLFITSTKSQESQLAFFNYTENITDTKFPQNAPNIVNIRTYDDGTALVHIIRDSVQQADCLGHSLEPILRIRVIQLNGSVIEINDNLNLDSLNYCLFTNINGILVNPIVIYPLQQPYVLINYYKAKNSSDIKTYEEWGQVIDWSGKILSNISFGPSYFDSQGVLTPVSKIQLNINKRLGFLRYAAIDNGTSQWIEFQQYLVDNNGNLTMLTNENFTLPTFSSIQVATISTVNSGYGIFYAICTNNETDLLSIKCMLNAKFVSYNQTSSERVAVLYELSRNVNISGLYCDLVSVGLGHVCTLVIDSSSTPTTSSTANNITSPFSNNTYFIRVNFLSSGSVLSSNIITDILPSLSNVAMTTVDWRMKAMPFGGYILDNSAHKTSVYNISSYNVSTYNVSAYNNSAYNNSAHNVSAYNISAYNISASTTNNITAYNITTYNISSYNISNLNYHFIFAYDENNIQINLAQPGPFITNIFGVNDIMTNNNTFLLATPYTNDQNSSWSLSKIELPNVLKTLDHGYGNFWIDQTSPSINATVDLSTTTLTISFYNPVALSYDSLDSYITVYKTSDYKIRQKVSPTMYKFCRISRDGKQLFITIISSTFNQYGQYFVEMDNNFIKSKYYEEPLTGIAAGLWNLNSTYKSNFSDNTAVTGSVSLTSNGTENFLSYPNRSEYFKNLLDEISVKLPVRRDRLSTNEKFQYINYGTSNAQIIFSIRVNSQNSSTETPAQKVVSDLETMIIYKETTTFSNNLTNDFDNNYGFIVQMSLWDEYGIYIVVSILVLLLIEILYVKCEQSKQNEQNQQNDESNNESNNESNDESNDGTNVPKQSNFFLRTQKNLQDLILIWVKRDDLPKAREIAHTISGYILIAINLVFTAYFVFINSIDEPDFIWPSKVIWCFPIFVNLLIVTGLVLKKLLNKLGIIIIFIKKFFLKSDPEKGKTRSGDLENQLQDENSALSDDQRINKMIDISENTFNNLFSEISEIVKDNNIQDEFSKINIKDAIKNQRISDIWNELYNKRHDNEQLFDVIKNEIEIILLNELSYMCFLKKIKEEFMNEKLLKDIQLDQISNEIFKSFKSKIHDKINELSKRLEKSVINKHNKQSETITESFDLLDTILLIIQSISDAIQKDSHSIITKITTKLKDVLSTTNINISLNESQKNELRGKLKKILIKNADKTKFWDITEFENRLPRLPRVNNFSPDELKKNFLHRINAEEKKTKNTTALSMFIFFVILDSESLVILDDQTEKFIKHHKKFALVRAFMDIFIKSIPLIIVMAYYASSVIIYGFIPLMALILSCFKCIMSIILIVNFKTWLKTKKTIDEPSQDDPVKNTIDEPSQNDPDKNTI
ncbi:hypothetical protein C2G38_2138160 [Gigaspora rosea]|uniref:Uncharacterized protein n=1 Tax=Gigaspora rosea TaxID=44941 RepID=A0A397VVX4_9GLOM|nr:hypothetical protein C2G38_2138160 [Gigaspora rosea]